MENFAQMPVTFTLIILNVIISVLAWQNEPLMSRGLFHVGPMQTRNEWDRGITSGFLHLNFMHLLMNIYVLWMFGAVLEHPARLGSTNFAIVYAVSLIGGSAWSYMENFRNPDYRALGASGAVSGVVIGACLFIPLAQLSLLGVLPMPAVVFAVGFILISAMLSTRENTIIGHDAHLGGALAGLAATVSLKPEVWPSFIAKVSKALGLM